MGQSHLGSKNLGNLKKAKSERGQKPNSLTVQGDQRTEVEEEEKDSISLMMIDDSQDFSNSQRDDCLASPCYSIDHEKCIGSTKFPKKKGIAAKRQSK